MKRICPICKRRIYFWQRKAWFNVHIKCYLTQSTQAQLTLICEHLAIAFNIGKNYGRMMQKSAKRKSYCKTFIGKDQKSGNKNKKGSVRGPEILNLGDPHSKYFLIELKTFFQENKIKFYLETEFNKHLADDGSWIENLSGDLIESCGSEVRPYLRGWNGSLEDWNERWHRYWASDEYKETLKS